MPFHLPPMKLALFSEENSWKNKNLGNGINERKILKNYKMKGLICFSLLLSKEKRRQKRNMLKELKKLDSKRPKIKKEESLKSKRKELKFLEKCLKQERMLIKEEIRETLLKIMLILDLQFMLQLPEMVYL